MIGSNIEVSTFIRNCRIIHMMNPIISEKNSHLWLTVQQLRAHTMCPASFESSLYIIGSSEVCVNKSSLYLDTIS